MIIIGAGMAGCIAAIMNQNSVILEASEKPPTNHNAVLRFRSEVVSQVTGIPFKKVTVRKCIWFDGEKAASPRMANMYSKKVTGEISDRSIWNLDTVERWVAPADFHQKMIEMLGNRIVLNSPVTKISKSEIAANGIPISREGRPIVSTMPMGIANKIVFCNKNTPFGIMNFKTNYKNISTVRYKIKDCDVNQTIYYPDPNSSVYRATLTGGDLIIELMGDSIPTAAELYEVRSSFGIMKKDCRLIQEASLQKYGKISEVDDKSRRDFIFTLTSEYNMYSLGRFGIWKNILLDDVVKDVGQIKKMMESDRYNHLLKS